jgi:hypothetical protein
MDLSEIYANRVKKSPVSTLSVGGHFPSIQTRDSTINKLEIDVFSKMKEIIGKDSPTNNQNIPKPSVKSLSFEEALKELSNLNKQ